MISCHQLDSTVVKCQIIPLSIRHYVPTLVSVLMIILICTITDTLVLIVSVQVIEEIVPQIGSTNYTLTCTLSGAEGHPINNMTLQWFKDVNGTRVKVGGNTSSLSFYQPFKLSSAGRYTCEVSRMYINSSSVLAKAEASWDVRIQSEFLML